MIRFTLRQFRTQAAVAFGALVLVAIIVAITGPHLRQLYDNVAATCRMHGNCSTAYSSYLNTDSTLRTWLGILVIVAPGVIGIFWGAPLVARELEAGTYRLTWTQSVTRSRWLATKLCVVGLVAIIVAGLLSLMTTVWTSPLDRSGMNVFGTFDQRDLVPVGYAAFAFVLGVMAGMLFRRILPAMATTLVAFVAARVAFNGLLRPHLISPTIRDLSLNLNSTGFGSTNGGAFTLLADSPNIPNAWITSTQIVDKSGHALTPQDLARACPNLVRNATTGAPQAGSGHSFRVQAPPGAQDALKSCLSKVNASFHEVVTYQPSSHFWTFQWYELAAYLVAAFILAGVCLWWIRHRMS